MQEEMGVTEEQTRTGARKAREVSRYAFPYYDLETAIGVAKALHDRAGGKASLAQLASYLGHTDEFSGAFRAKAWGARLFGLVNITSNIVSITPLGEQLASLRAGLQRDRRLAEAFLNVPLFREVYKRYEGSTFPSAREGLKSALHGGLGVPARVAPVALKTLLLSADQAGFRRENPTRLIHPIPIGLVEKDVVSEGATEGDDTGVTEAIPQGTKVPQSVHPAIGGLLLELPQTGARWAEGERQRWIEAFVALIKALYPTEDEG